MSRWETQLTTQLTHNLLHYYNICSSGTWRISATSKFTCATSQRQTTCWEQTIMLQSNSDNLEWSGNISPTSCLPGSFVCLPNRQRTLNKLLTELWCNFFLVSTNWAYKSTAKRAKTCMHCVQHIPTEIHFAYHHWWLGSSSLSLLFPRKLTVEKLIPSPDYLSLTVLLLLWFFFYSQREHLRLFLLPRGLFDGPVVPELKRWLFLCTVMLKLIGDMVWSLKPSLIKKRL